MKGDSSIGSDIASKPDARVAGLDALRGCVALLVVLHHAAIVYGAQGGWYYHELAPSDRPSSILLTFFCTLNQAWFMGLFFLLAGYFTPPALARRGPSAFAADRVLRLGLPILGYALLLHPITVALAQTTRGRPYLETLAHVWRGAHFETGPLWFALALLAFTFAWLVFGRRWPSPKNFPSNRDLLWAALLTGAAAFLLRLHWPVGAEVAGMQFGYFASYAVLFVAGCLAAQARLLQAIPAGSALFWRRVAKLAAPVLPAVFLIDAWLGHPLGRFEGGLNAAALVYAFWEPFVAWGIILGLLVAFQKRFTILDGVSARLARRSFAIYVIHPPILTGVAVAWAGVEAPPLLKFAATGVAACLACHLAAGLVLRAPGVDRIL